MKRKIINSIVIVLPLIIIVCVYLFFVADENENIIKEIPEKTYPIHINDKIDIFLSSFNNEASPILFNELKIKNHHSDKLIDIINSDRNMSFVLLNHEDLVQENINRDIVFDSNEPFILAENHKNFYEWGNSHTLDGLFFEDNGEKIFIVYEYRNTTNHLGEEIIQPQKGYVFALFNDEKGELSLKKIFETKHQFYHAFIENNQLVFQEKEEIKHDSTKVPSFLRSYILHRYVFENGTFEHTNQIEVHPIHD